MTVFVVYKDYGYEGYSSPLYVHSSLESASKKIWENVSDSEISDHCIVEMEVDGESTKDVDILPCQPEWARPSQPAKPISSYVDAFHLMTSADRAFHQEFNERNKNICRAYFQLRDAVEPVSANKFVHYEKGINNLENKEQ